MQTSPGSSASATSEPATSGTNRTSPRRSVDEQREREARLAEKAAQRAAAQPPVVASRGIPPPREDMSAYETMMAAGGTSPQEEFGRIPPPRFLEEALEAGQRHLASERAKAKKAKSRLMGGK